MKTLIKLLSTTLLLVGSILTGTAIKMEAASETPPPPAVESLNHAVVFGSPYQADDARAVSDQFLFMLLTKARAKSTYWVIDGWNLKTIVQITVPDLKLDRPEARKRALARELGLVLGWFKQQTPATNMTSSALIRLPELSDFIAQRKPTGPLTVFIAANPLYLPTGEDVAFAFAGRRYPSRGYLAARRLDSPFSLEGRAGQLRGVTINFNYLHENEFLLGDGHRTMILDFWRAFLEEGEGAKLNLFDSDLASFFGNTTVVTRPTLAATPPDLKPEMLTAPPPGRGLAVAAAAAPVTNVSPQPAALPVSSQVVLTTPPPERVTVVVPTQPPLTNVALPNPEAIPVPLTESLTNPPPVRNSTPPEPTAMPVPPKGKTGIGIAWGAIGASGESVDVDLYLRPAKGLPEISWKRPVVEDRARGMSGTLYKDWRAANDQSEDTYEYVELSGPVDLRQIAAWANLYSGRLSHPLIAKIIVHQNGVAYRGTFTITARTGNTAVGWNNEAARSRDPAWVALDIQKLVGKKVLATEPGRTSVP